MATDKQVEIGIGVDLTALRKGLADAEGKLKNFGKKNEKLFENLEKNALPSAAVFATIAAGVGIAAKSFAEFEAVLNEFRAVSGATASEMDRIKATALDLGAKTKYSAKEAAQGLSELAKSGFTVEQSIAAIPGVMALAAAGGVSVGQAAEAAGAALNGFGLAAEEASKVADILATAANISAVGVGDLQNSLKYIAPVAASTSQSIEEVATVLSIMGNAGIKGDQAGTSVRSSLASLLKPSQEAAKTMHALGIAIQDTQGDMLPLTQIIGQLREKTATMTEVQRGNAIATIFGQEAVSGLLAVMRQTPAQIDAARSSIDAYNGAAQEMAEVMNSGLKGAVEQLSGSMDTLMTGIGEEFAPIISALAKGAQSATDALSSMPGPLKTVLAGALTATAAFTGLTAAAGGLATAIGVLRVSAALLGVTLGGPLAAIAAISVALGVATVAYKANADAVNEARKREDEARKARLDAVTSAKSQRDALTGLVSEYEKLSSKAKLSKEEQERLKTIGDKLKADYPAIADAIGKAGVKHDSVAEAVKREIAAKNDLIQTNIQLARYSAYSSQKELERETEELGRLQRAYDDAVNSPSYGDSTGRAAELKVIGEALGKQKEVVDSIAKRTMDAVKEADRLNKIVNPAKPSKKKPVGNVVDEISSTSGTKKSPAEEKAEKDLDRLTRQMNQALAKSDQLGGGLEEQRAIWNKYLADIGQLGNFERVKQAMDGAVDEIELLNIAIRQQADESAFQETKAALDALGNVYQRVYAKSIAMSRAQIENEKQIAKDTKDRAALEQQLTISRLDGVEKMRAEVEAAYDAEIRAADEAFEAARQAANSNVDLTKGQKDAAVASAAAIRDVKKEIAEAGRIKGLESANKRITASIREMQGAITALAIDPSLERIANFAEDLASDEDKIQRWGEAFSEAGDAFDEAEGGINGVSAASSTVISKLNPIVLFMQGVAAVGGWMAQIWKDAEAAQVRMSHRTKSLTLEVAKINASLIDDPFARAKAERDAAFKELDQEASEKLNEAIEDAGKNGVLFMKVPTLDDFPDLRKWYDAHDAAIQKAHADAIEAANKATGSLDAERAALERVTEAAREYGDGIDRIIEIEDELNSGEHDDRGLRVSLKAKAELDVARQREATENRIADLKKKQAEYEREISEINKAEAERIAEIENEGIAVRARTERQDKNARISKVRAEAEEQRKAKIEQITLTQQEILEEQRQGDLAIERIQNLSKERITALENERLKQEAVVNQAMQHLNIERSITAEVNARRSGSGSYSAPSMASHNPTEVRLALAGMSRKYHTGGTALGADEVPAVLKKNEFVFTPEQASDLFKAAGRGGGSITIAPGAIVIHGAGDPRAIAREFDAAIGRIVRRTGL